MSHAFQTTKRKNLTPQQKAAIFLKRGGRCCACERKLSAGDIWTIEHLKALENGGTNKPANLDIICDWCRPSKDRVDHERAAKTRHQAANHVVPTREKKSKPRSFSTNRSGRWKKKMDGTVERRS